VDSSEPTKVDAFHIKCGVVPMSDVGIEMRTLTVSIVSASVFIAIGSWTDVNRPAYVDLLQ
jgi:hypothetical protein